MNAEKLREEYLMSLDAAQECREEGNYAEEQIWSRYADGILAEAYASGIEI